MIENEIILHYKQFINEKSLNRDKSFKDLCHYVIKNIDNNSNYYDLVDNIYKLLKNHRLTYISSVADSMQLHFESTDDKFEKDLIFEGVIHFSLGNLDFDNITNINISYGYSVSIFHSMKNNKVLFGTMFWDKFDKVMPKATIVAEKLIVKSN